MKGIRSHGECMVNGVCGGIDFKAEITGKINSRGSHINPGIKLSGQACTVDDKKPIAVGNTENRILIITQVEGYVIGNKNDESLGFFKCKIPGEGLVENIQLDTGSIHPEIRTGFKCRAVVQKDGLAGCVDGNSQSRSE